MMQFEWDAENEEDDEMPAEYDFCQGVRGKHFREYQQGYTVTITHPDGTQTVEQVTPDPAACGKLSEPRCVGLKD